jgi:hypothetical protein
MSAVIYHQVQIVSEVPKRGGELFIVDNSDEFWKGLK